MSQVPNADDVVGDQALALEEVVDRGTLADLCTSFARLTGTALRVYAESGALLAHAEGVPSPRKTEGNLHAMVSLEYDGRSIGRVELSDEAPGDAERLAQLGAHLKEVLELLVFTSHKAWLTSKMHLLSAAESYRELQGKTAQLEDTLLRLKEADRLKSSFLATLSHELRTPLTSIIGYSELLADGLAGALTEEQTEFVKTIHAKGEELLRLMTGLLDMSKVESGTMKLRASSVQILPILEAVIATLVPAARKKGVELLLETDEVACELAADPERLRQVFVNLVDNAIKFTPTGGRVTVNSRVNDSSISIGFGEDAGAILLAPAMKQVQVRVADTGVGIPPSERTKVFGAFYQVDSTSSREHVGTGLGLSIVKRIVEAHGGRVFVDANLPTGTVFTVELPSALAHRAALPSRVPTAMP